MTPLNNKPRPFDPTENVIALFEANKKSSERDLASAVLRLDDLAKAESKRTDDLMAQRDSFHERLSVAESRRVDALRAGDVSAGSMANERAAAQAVLLANQVSQSAETLRTLVASTAQAVALQMKTLQDTLADRIAALEKARWESAGKSALSTPLMMMLAAGGGALVVWLLKITVNIP
jgi:hypothetical protein